MPSPRRRLLVALVCCSLVTVGGCLGVGESTKTESNCPDERVTPVPYPDRPATLTNDSVGTFVSDVERAYLNGEYADGNTTSVGVDLDPDRVNRTDDGWVVTVESLFSTHHCVDGSLGVSDGTHRVQYFVNESAVFRLEHGRANETPRGDGMALRLWTESTTA